MVSRYVTNGPVKEGICLLPPTHYRMMPPQRKFFEYAEMSLAMDDAARVLLSDMPRLLSRQNQ